MRSPPRSGIEPTHQLRRKQMGRPLKIAKAQAILTITGTTAATSAVTVSQNLNTLVILRGMQFVTASSVGGLSANTVYWVLNVIDANNFTVSATSPDANTTSTPVTLSDTTSQTVSASVNVVDAYFNNPVSGAGFPTTNANTYSVVGGNTAIVGPQVLCNVAIGQTGVGTVFASTSSNVVTGLGTNFANVPSGTNMYALWGNDPTNPHLLGTTSASGSNVLVGLANTSATGNIIGVDVGSNAQVLVSGGPVTFDVTAGGIVAGKQYFVNVIANAAAFTIAAYPGGPNVALSTVASVAGNAGQQQIVLDAVSANNATGADGYGDPFVYATLEDGYIVRQKGKQKYLVQGLTTGLLGPCYTANVANTALLPNTMTITATYANADTVSVQSLSDHTTELFTSTSGVTAIQTDNINNASPAYATFNTAYDANTYSGQPYPIVTIDNA